MAAQVRKFTWLGTRVWHFRRLCCNVNKITPQRTFSHENAPVAITFSEFGDPRKVLKKETVSIPSRLRSSEILVKMLMAPINPSDINMIEGTYHIRPALPALVGNEGVGEVIAVGNDVRGLEKGDWVLPAEAGWGTWRTLAVCENASVQKIPNDIPVLSAATLAVNPCTAYRMLKDFVPVSEGDVIIQNGANSAVGQCVIQLAKHMGITTINIVRDRPDIDQLTVYLKSLGATHVVTDTFAMSRDMQVLLSEFPNKPRLTFNCVGGKIATELTRFLAPNGVMVTYGGMSKKPVVIPTSALIFKEIRLAGYWNTQWNKRNSGSVEKDQMYKELCDLMRTGKLLPPASDLVPIDRFEEAVAHALEGFREKKKILVMDKERI